IKRDLQLALTRRWSRGYSNWRSHPTKSLVSSRNERGLFESFPRHQGAQTGLAVLVTPPALDPTRERVVAINFFAVANRIASISAQPARNLGPGRAAATGFPSSASPRPNRPALIRASTCFASNRQPPPTLILPSAAVIFGSM